MEWLISFALEGLYFASPGNKRIKRPLGIIVLLIVIGSTYHSLASFSGYFFWAVLLLLPFRILNIARGIKHRMHPQYLRRAGLRTGASLAALHLAVYIFTRPEFHPVYRYLIMVQLAIAVVMLYLVVLHIVKTRHVKNATHFSDKELPTVSVCIPARNETDALEQCLRTVLANTYPKIEILVLDDCSHERTADVIKSFAHDGVRFIQGEPPEERWLAKNQAYHKLLQEANGELVLFCGVDVRFGPHAINALVTTMLNRKKSMISVMPLRFYSKISEAFVQPMRYWWELAPPRKLVNRPPVLSTCWLVNRKKLLQAGGFKSASHAIIPEGVFARRFIKNNEYSFIRADKELDVRTTKPFKDQVNTAIRTNYPQIRRRPEMALILTIFTISILILPYFQILHGILIQDTVLMLASLLTSLLLTATHVLILSVSDPANIPVAVLNLPLAAFIEMIIGYSSMLKYEFGSVAWKGRNICVPVMHTIPKKDFIDQLEHP